jgi:probable addiction module antidote protein
MLSIDVLSAIKGAGVGAKLARTIISGDHWLDELTRAAEGIMARKSKSIMVGHAQDGHARGGRPPGGDPRGGHPRGRHPQGPQNFAVAYLNVLIDDADQEELIAALGRIAHVRGGPKLAEKVELNATSLYRTLCRRGNPELKSVATLLKAMGIRLTLQPLIEGNRIQLLRARRQMKLDEEAACH